MTKRHLRYLVVAIIFAPLALVAINTPSFATNCDSPPSGFGGAWARAYAAWCQQCGGRYNSSNQSCTPGPNWGGSGGGGQPNPAPGPAYDPVAEQHNQALNLSRDG